MNQLPIKTIIITVVLFIIMGLFLYFHIEKYTIEKRVEQPYEVRRNPFLAAEYYLKQRHQKVTVINNIQLFKTLSPHKQTVLLLGDRNNFSTNQIQLLLDWVKQGGILIVEANRTTLSKKPNNTDNLLTPLGIQVSKSYDYDKTNDVKLYIENEEKPAHFKFNDSWQLIDQKGIATFWAATNKGTIKLLQFTYGKGKITVLSSAYIWRNNAIGNNDHAWLLSYLTAGYPVTILYKPISQTKQHPSVLLAAIKNYPHTLLVSMALIFLILWFIAIRSGPLESPIEKNRRQLPLQLTAQGNFLYKQIGQQQLIMLLQQEIYYLVKKRSPHFDSLANDEQYNFLSKLTQQPITSIRRIMSPMTSHSRFSKVEFTQIIIALQAIRNAL